MSSECRWVTPSDLFHAGLTTAFPAQPGWIVRERQPVESYQQRMERVTLEWPDTGASADVFVRIYRGYMSWWTLEAPHLPEREQTAWRVAGRAGVPIPETLCAFRSAEGAVAVQRSVPGTQLRKQSVPEVVESLASALARLHAADVQKEDRVHLPDVSLPALLPRLATWAGETEDRALCQAIANLADQMGSIEERPVAFLHGDCHLGNILADGPEITAVIDWEEAALGDPRIDVAWVEAGLRRHSAELADRFLVCYQELTGYTLGSLQIWGELTELRSRIVSAWVRRSLDQGRLFPSDNPEVWVW